MSRGSRLHDAVPAVFRADSGSAKRDRMAALTEPDETPSPDAPTSVSGGCCPPNDHMKHAPGHLLPGTHTRQQIYLFGGSEGGGAVDYERGNNGSEGDGEGRFEPENTGSNVESESAGRVQECGISQEVPRVAKASG